MVTAIAADDLQTPETRASAAMLLTLFDLHLELSISEKLIQLKNQFMHASIIIIVWYLHKFPKCIS